MTIQEIIKKLEKEEDVNFNVAERLIGGSANLLCRFNNFEDWMKKDDMMRPRPMTAVLRHPEDLRFGFSDHTVQKRMNIELPEGNINLVIVPDNFGYHTETGGKVDELKFLITTGNIKSCFYRLAGGKIEKSINIDPINWKRKYEDEQDEIDAEFKYDFHHRRLEINLSRAVSVDSSFYHEIDNYIKDEVLLFCYIFSFCIGTPVEILTRLSLSSEGEEVYFNYKSRNTEDSYRNLNAMTPMRELPDLWINFLQHVLKKENVTYSWLIESRLFQAIGNLYYDNINEWVLIKLAAALEGLCDKPSILKRKKYSKIREVAIEAVMSKYSELEIKTEEIDQVVKNVELNHRSLNGYPVKWHIEKTLKDCNLEKFSENYIEKINDAINIRNTVVHEGWAEDKKWKTALPEHIKTLRSTIFLIVLARLEYPGKFFFSGHEYKETTSLQEWQIGSIGDAMKPCPR